MKNQILFRSPLLPTLAMAMAAAAHGQIAISPNAATVPNTHAMLDVSDVTRGLLAPRFAWANRPVPGAPENSLLYYQTDSSTTTQEGVGYYYWDNTIPAWVHLSMGPGWRIGGNTGTNPATNFIGTTNNQDMAIRTNGLERVRLRASPAGQVQVGTTAAANERFEVNGAMRVYTANPPATASDATPVPGAIRYNSTSGAHDGYVDNPVAVGPLTQYQGWYQLENAFKTRVKQKYATVPNLACRYPASTFVWNDPSALVGVVDPAGATVGTWLEFNGPNPDVGTSATLETPYSTFWEDGRHQYLYRSADLEALGICPNTDVRGIAFRVAGTPAAIGMRNIKVRMKNELAPAMTGVITAGLTDCAAIATYPAAPFPAVNGWNKHMFNVVNWQWNGVGNNMLVEYCFDNQDWTFNSSVYFEATAYNAMFGLYCDACGHPSGAQTCYYAGPCNGANNAPSGGSQLTPGILCTGWGWNGFAGGGCAWTTTTSLLTCDGTYQYQGQWTVAAKRPILKILAATTGTTVSYYNGRYLLAEGEGVMIGDYAAWANTGSGCSTWQFKGPGTVAARVGVWSGNVLLNDHVFDNYYDGRIKPEDQQQAVGYHHYPVKEMVNYVEKERHLPTIGGREAWNDQGGFSADQLTNQLWVTMETQSIYIKELNERMNALQEYLVEKRLKESQKK